MHEGCFVISVLNYRVINISVKISGSKFLLLAVDHHHDDS